MRYKKIDINDLTETEEKIRWELQYEYNYKQEYIVDDRIAYEWNGMMLLADIIVAPRKWAVVNGIVTLMEENK